MSSYFKATVLISSFLLVISCNCKKSDLSNYGQSFEKIMKSDNGIFRGVELGMCLENIKQQETISASEEDTNYLYYENALDSSNSFTVAYDFDQKKLKEIQLEVFINNIDEFSNLVATFKNYYENKYGKAENTNGFLIWTIKDINKGNVKITLADESTDFEYSKLSLSVYNAEY